MLKKDDGIVLGTSRSGETSRLVTFLGRRSGKIRLVGKGALAEKSPFRGALEPGTELEVVFYYKEERSRHFIKEVSPRFALGSRRDSLPLMGATLAVLEIAEHVCGWGEADERIVELLAGFLRFEGMQDPLFAVLVFQFKLLEILGTLPEFSHCAACGMAIRKGVFSPAEGASFCAGHAPRGRDEVPLSPALIEALARMASAAPEELWGGEVTADVRKQLGKAVHRTYTYHVHGYSLPNALKLIPKDR